RNFQILARRPQRPLYTSAWEPRGTNGVSCSLRRLTRFGKVESTDKMGFQNIWYSHPRKYGQGSRSCRACSNRHGLIRKYGLNICRQCFREYAADIGFK
ncbi:hypothetical protein TSAR_003254, partial [Trichomalopsis sarcophagae]